MTSTINADKIMNSSGDQDSGLDLLVNDQVKIKTANTDRITVTDATTTIANNLNVTGNVEPTGSVRVDDGQYFQAGNSYDLQMYHDGSNSFIEDQGTGDLRLKGSVIRLLSDQINLSNNANTIDGLTMDSSGRIKKPKQPAFFAGFSNNAYYNVGTTNGTAYRLQPYTDENQGKGYNIGSHYNNSTFRFTAPIAGRYHFAAQFFTNYSSNYMRYGIDFRKNGSVFHTRLHPMWEGTGSVYTQVIMSLTANDYIEVYVYGEDTNALSNTWQIYQSSRYTWFQGELLG